MLKIIFCAGTAAAISGCAYVPDPTPEETLGFSEIVQQLECETFFAIQDLERPELHDPYDEKKQANAWADLDHWGFAIEIKPQKTFDGQISLSGSYKDNAQKIYRQISLGGPASPGNLDYEGRGNTNIDNAYNVSVQTLYDEKSRQRNYRGTKGLNKRLVCSTSDEQAPLGRIGSRINGQVPIADFHDGVFGIHKYLQRTLAAGAPLGTEPKTMTFSKEYNFRIQAGVTPGWYVPLSNTSPGVGFYYLIDDTISITFTPPTPNPPPAKRITFGQPERKGRLDDVMITFNVQQHHRIQRRKANVARPTTLPSMVPLSPGQENQLLDSRGLSATQQLLNRLDSLPSR